MRTKKCLVNKDKNSLNAILKETETAAAYHELSHKETLRLRLLAEELIGMLSGLLYDFEGEFWIENVGRRCELHVEVSAENITKDTKDRLISVSRSQKNAAAVGIMGRVREVMENMLLYASSPEGEVLLGDWCPSMEVGMEYQYTRMWTLRQYREVVESKQMEDEWDELEKSIVAKLADDVIVGVKNCMVEIVIKKRFG